MLKFHITYLLVILQASNLLQHICKAGNGSIPKTRSWGSPKNSSPSSKKSKHHKSKEDKGHSTQGSGVNGGHGGGHSVHGGSGVGLHGMVVHAVSSGAGAEPFISSSTAMEKSAEERLAR